MEVSGKCLNPKSKLRAAETLPGFGGLEMEVSGEGGQWHEGGRWVGRRKGGR